MSDVLLDLSLEKQECGNDQQQHADRAGNKKIDPIAVAVPQVLEQPYAQRRTGHAAHGQRQHNPHAHGAPPQMNDTGTNLREEVKKSV